MPIGAGKYDALCTYVRERAQATGAIVIVIGGTHGGGFSVQAPPDLAARLPQVLESVAKEMRDSMNEGYPP